MNETEWLDGCLGEIGALLSDGDIQESVASMAEREIAEQYDVLGHLNPAEAVDVVLQDVFATFAARTGREH